MSNLGGGRRVRNELETERALRQSERMAMEEKARKEREKAERLFIRSYRARQGSGFFGRQETQDTLG